MNSRFLFLQDASPISQSNFYRLGGKRSLNVQCVDGTCDEQLAKDTTDEPLCGHVEAAIRAPNQVVHSKLVHL